MLWWIAPTRPISWPRARMGGPRRSRPRAGTSSPISGWARSEEHTSELQSLMRISYAVFCLKKKKTPALETQYVYSTLLNTRNRLLAMMYKDSIQDLHSQVL